MFLNAYTPHCYQKLVMSKPHFFSFFLIQVVRFQGQRLLDETPEVSNEGTLLFYIFKASCYFKNKCFLNFPGCITKGKKNVLSPNLKLGDQFLGACLWLSDLARNQIKYTGKEIFLPRVIQPGKFRKHLLLK